MHPTFLSFASRHSLQEARHPVSTQHSHEAARKGATKQAKAKVGSAQCQQKYDARSLLETEL